MKNIINALSDFYRSSCQERQEFLMEQWARPAADRDFYDIINACRTENRKVWARLG